MDETLIRGAITGAALAAVYVVVVMIKKLLNAQSESARRVRVVAGIALTLLIGSMLFSMFGIEGTLIVAAVVGAIIWVLAGKGK